MSNNLRKGDRVVVTLGINRSRKFGTVTGETKDGLSWVVLIDGNRGTNTYAKHKCDRLLPTQLAFYFGDKGRIP